jgi:hypothetical protein
MSRHYSYRVDHDLGFAPHIDGALCTVCGCKTTTVERWAQVGSWVIGIGGNGTGRPDKLIYAMRVDAIPAFRNFARDSPRQSAYLRKKVSSDAPVLVSHHFFYFGDHAITLPRSLRHIIIGSQGCRRLDDADVEALDQLLSRRHGVGVHGLPNGPNTRMEPARPSCCALRSPRRAAHSQR